MYRYYSLYLKVPVNSTLVLESTAVHVPVLLALLESTGKQVLNLVPSVHSAQPYRYRYLF